MKDIYIECVYKTDFTSEDGKKLRVNVGRMRVGNFLMYLVNSRNRNYQVIYMRPDRTMLDLIYIVFDDNDHTELFRSVSLDTRMSDVMGSIDVDNGIVFDVVEYNCWTDDDTGIVYVHDDYDLDKPRPSIAIHNDYTMMYKFWLKRIRDDEYALHVLCKNNKCKIYKFRVEDVNNSKFPDDEEVCEAYIACMDFKVTCDMGCKFTSEYLKREEVMIEKWASMHAHAVGNAQVSAKKFISIMEQK